MELSKLSRVEVEDKVYQLTSESTDLKKQRLSQDENMKRLATKILRLKSDMKKLQVGKPTKYTNDNEVVEDLKMKISQLEQEVASLKQKLVHAKNVTPDKSKQAQQKTYSFVEPRVDSGLPYKPGGVVMPKMRTPIKMTPTKQTPNKQQQFQKPPQFPQYGQSMLNNARQEIEELDEIVDSLKFQIAVLEDEKQDLINKQQDTELGYENKLLALREQLLEQQRTGISEDIDLINLQRQVKNYEDQLSDETAKVLKLRNELNSSRKERDRAEEDMADLQGEMEKMTAKLRTSRNKADESLQQSNQAHEMSIALEEVEREREILKQENSRLIEDVFNVEKEKQYKQNERKLRERVRQLEHRLERLQNTPQKDGVQHDEVFDKYLVERDRATDLEHKVNKLELTNREMEIELEKTKEILEEEEKLRIREGEERRREERIVSKETVTRDHMEELTKQEIKKTVTFETESEVADDVSRELRELQTEHAALVMELDKVNMLLDIQYKLKQDYQDEVASLNAKYDSGRREYARREDETAKLLDVRNHKINKLELQLRDIAYGTKQVKIEPTSDSDSPADYNISLERGQNVAEIHVGKLYIAHDGMLSPEEKLFVVLNFYHFETVVSKVVRGVLPDFNTTSQFIVNVDDFFLKALQSGTAGVYLYSCNGVEFRCIGACQMQFKEMLSQTSNSRVHGSLQLLGTMGDTNGVVFANLEYYCRLKFPITHSLTLFKEKIKAHTYLNSNTETSDPASEDTPRDNYNELKITIVSCSQLNSAEKNTQPSPYVMYKFYNFADHDTPIVDSSNSPQYNDVKTFPVTSDELLHRYLTQAVCHVYVFNDAGNADSLMGVVEVPLLPLAHGKSISGTFEISRKALGGGVVGIMSLKMEWGFSYLPPSSAPDILAPQPSRNRQPCDVDTEPQKLLPEHYEQIAEEQDRARQKKDMRQAEEDRRREEAARIRREEAERMRRTDDEDRRSAQGRENREMENKERENKERENKVRENKEREMFEIAREEKKSAAQHVTFVVEENKVKKQHSVEEVEAPKTDFMSFRSAEDYEKAMKAKNLDLDLQGLQISQDSESEQSSDIRSYLGTTNAVGGNIDAIDALNEDIISSAVSCYPDVSNDDPVAREDPIKRDLQLTRIDQVTRDDPVTPGNFSDVSEELELTLSVSGDEANLPLFTDSSNPQTADIKKNDIQSPLESNGMNHPDKLPIAASKKVEVNEFDDSTSEDEDVMIGTLGPKSPGLPSKLSLYKGIEDLDDMVDAEVAPHDSLEGVSPLAAATPQSGNQFNNTFFEEEPSDDSLDDIVIPSGSTSNHVGEEETLEQITERMMSSDDEDVVMVKPRDFSRTVDSLGETLSSTQVPTPRPPPLIVIIHYVMFNSDAYFVLEDNIDQVFVEYKLLNVDPADTETPGSVKVSPDTKLFFNFRKTFYIEKGTEDCRMLTDIVFNSADKTMSFTVVSDPGESTDAECFNLCKASVDLPTLSDIIEQELPLYGERDGKQVGRACVTIETVKAIQALSDGTN